VQSAVGIPVTAAVKPTSDYLARGGLYGRDPAEAGERRLAAQTLRVVPGYYEERSSMMSTDGG
jgi:hypothetical protein